MKNLFIFINYFDKIHLHMKHKIYSIIITTTVNLKLCLPVMLST